MLVTSSPSFTGFGRCPATHVRTKCAANKTDTKMAAPRIMFWPKFTMAAEWTVRHTCSKCPAYRSTGMAKDHRGGKPYHAHGEIESAGESIECSCFCVVVCGKTRRSASTHAKRPRRKPLTKFPSGPTKESDTSYEQKQRRQNEAPLEAFEQSPITCTRVSCPAGDDPWRRRQRQRDKYPADSTLIASGSSTAAREAGWERSSGSRCGCIRVRPRSRPLLSTPPAGTSCAGQGSLRAQPTSQVSGCSSSSRVRPLQSRSRWGLFGGDPAEPWAELRELQDSLPGRTRWHGEPAPLVRPGPRVAYVEEPIEREWSALAERVVEAMCNQS